MTRAYAYNIEVPVYNIGIMNNEKIRRFLPLPIFPFNFQHSRFLRLYITIARLLLLDYS